MAKTAIVTDSNSGITPEIAEEMGIFLLPMPFMINGKEYFDGKNLEEKWFYEQQRADAEILSSQPAPGAVTEMWDRILKDYDEIVHIPTSRALSNSCATAQTLAEDYGGKVQVADNKRISVTLRRSVEDAVMLANAGKGAEEIRQILEKTALDSSIYAAVTTLKYLKKGGRITPAVAAIGTVLRLKPVLQIQGEKLDSFSNARTLSQAKKTMIDAVKSDIENRFGGLDAHDVYIDLAYANDREGELKFRDEVEEALPGYKVGFIDPLSLSVGCHIGEGAIAVAVTKKLHV